MAHEDKSDREVTIHIDKKQHKSPNPTTGAALYILGSVNSETHDLFRETHGQEDDELIQNDSASLELKNGDHFFSIKKKLNPGNRLWR